MAAQATPNKALGYVWLIDVRLSFADLWIAKGFTDKSGETSEPQFQATAIMKEGHPSIDVVRKMMVEVAASRWGGKATAILEQLRLNDRLALRDCARKGDTIGYDEGGCFLKASNAVRPTIVDRDHTPLVVSDGRPYPGCYVNMNVQLWAQDNGFGKRINATLAGVQFVRHGDAFGGGARPTPINDFPVIAGSDADDFGDLT